MRVGDGVQSRGSVVSDGCMVIVYRECVRVVEERRVVVVVSSFCDLCSAESFSANRGL